MSAVELRHDPGGKVRLGLQPGVLGAAKFHGVNGEYRLWLSRSWGDVDNLGFPHSYVLWVGMNPSTAAADVDDPTVRREIDYTRTNFGVSGYLKCNVMDYRATKPADLLKPGVKPRSELNVPTILRLARNAEKIIMCFGAPPKKLRIHGTIVAECLQSEGHELWCLGLTKEGGPRHPLYLAKGTPLQLYKGV